MRKVGTGIDVVIMWVDGNDPKWKKERDRYASGRSDEDNQDKRFRDWDNLKYVFRGIEFNMPWIRKVHLVTYGHLPKWLNLSNEKLHVVLHSDYIPSQFLPTFNSRAIQLNLHRIGTLSEQFIMFNDDMFVVRPVDRNLFFSNSGLPVEQAGFTIPHSAEVGDIWSYTKISNSAALNMNFTARDVLAKNWKKYFSLKNGMRSVAQNIALLPFSFHIINSHATPHFPAALLKSTYNDIWGVYEELLTETSSHRFRSPLDVSDALIRQWQLATGNFIPGNILSRSAYVSRFPEDIPKLERALQNRRMKQVCINDHEVKGDFEDAKEAVNKLLENILPIKSSFEL